MIFLLSWIRFSYAIEETLDFSDFDIYQGKVTKFYVEKKIKRYLEKDPQIQEYYQITDEALIIKDGRGHIDYTLFFGELEASRPEKKSFVSLQGARIALDPGHFGGRYAKLEKRYLEGSWQGKKGVNLNEGTLTFLTAVKLKSLLEAEGAIVFITRPSIGFGAIEIDFETYLDNHPELMESHLSLSTIFQKNYNHEDLKRRAEKINAFNPDLALVIHYNASLSKISPNDYCLAFVPGAFMKGELDKAKARYAFLRLLLTDSIEKSIQLSTYVLTHLQNELELPLMKEKSGPNTIKICKGIYCRNLLLTRTIDPLNSIPLCYLEALMQNYPDELDFLLTKDTMIEGIPCSSRLEKVALACFYAIQDYFMEG